MRDRADPTNMFAIISGLLPMGPLQGLLKATDVAAQEVAKFHAFGFSVTFFGHSLPSLTSTNVSISILITPNPAVSLVVHWLSFNALSSLGSVAETV